MKKIKLFLLAAFSLLLPSCSNTPSSSHNENNSMISGNTENTNELSSELTEPIETIPLEHSASLKFPASGGNSSGETKPLVYSPQEAVNEEIESLEELPLEAENHTKFTNEANDSITDTSSPLRELLATYSSKVYTKTEDRQKNLRIVCEKLSGTILAPNQEFSYNETCGPYDKENGFGKATVFVGDAEVQDYGGGVCQLSSTLYNAIKDLNVEITERHLHSKKVYYVPDGEDATVSYGNLDFKFKNKNDYSLYLEATSDAEAVNVYVYKA